MTENKKSAGRSSEGPVPPRPAPSASPESLFKRLSRVAVLFIAAFFVVWLLLSVARAAVYKIRPYERGLHLRGGRFISVDKPGWHIRIPLVDTTIGITISERPGHIEQLAAMTSDDVTMDVSLLYTYRVNDPVRYALEIQEPDRIVFDFVQGKLRDVVNTKEMTEVMHSRAAINHELMEALGEREAQYGVEFVMVQIQSASPPQEVVTAIKDRMVALQRQEQAEAEAAQQRTLADAEFYAAQKQADGDAYQITTLAQADAQRITLTSQAQQEAVRAMLSAMEGKGTLAEQYIQLLIAQELRENSKWIISGGGESMPILDLREVQAPVEAEPEPEEAP
jgi:regulator of protease activity HflC (stomatin/prohibitin superfamily)